MPNYRRLHEDSLKANRPDLYRGLRRGGELREYLDDIQANANELHQTVLKQLAERNPYNPSEWGNSREAWEGWIERTADELVLHDRILVPDAETERAEREGGYTVRKDHRRC